MWENLFTDMRWSEGDILSYFATIWEFEIIWCFTTVEVRKSDVLQQFEVRKSDVLRQLKWENLTFYDSWSEKIWCFMTVEVRKSDVLRQLKWENLVAKMRWSRRWSLGAVGHLRDRSARLIWKDWSWARQPEMHLLIWRKWEILGVRFWVWVKVPRKTLKNSQSCTWFGGNGKFWELGFE